MTEETQTTETEPTTTSTETPERESPAFLGLKSEVLKSNERATKAEQALQDLKAAIADKDAVAETARLEAEGKHKEIAEREKARADALEDAHAATLKRMTLDTALLQAGVTNQFTRTGMITGCPAETEAADYVAQLQKDQPNLFKAPEMQGTTTPPQGAPSTSGNHQSLEQRLADGDPVARNEMLKKMQEGA